MKGKECFVREQSQGMVSIGMSMCSVVTQRLGDSPSVVFHPEDVLCFLENYWNGEED